MLHRLFLAACFVCATMIVAQAGAHAAGESTAVVDRLHSVLLSNMKDAAALKFTGRRDRLAPVVREVFDLETMARVSTGAAWQQMSESERTDMVDAFAEWTIANYASQFDGFDGERFEIKSETDAGRGNVMVNTELHASTETVALNYRLRKKDETWRIIDIYMDGAVSQLAMRRGEFAAVLGQGGVDNLIGHMRASTAKLAAGG
tara:strand:- start:235 stop:846 length:612 start_codon:yes stop_codon:yes gene_type:complete